jgi:MSHA biogenesis protein MshP
MMCRRLDSGFALPAVIFLMVIVTLLITYMSRIVSSESAVNNLNVLGMRAYWAAQSANEWAAYKIYSNALAATGSACPSTPANFTINGFSISVTCSSTAYTEGGSSGALYQISSRAFQGGSPINADYVSRTLDMVLDVH